MRKMRKAVAADLYFRLGLRPGASADQIRDAYFELAKAYHPDRRSSDAKADESFKEIVLAAAILRDPEKRKLYDRGEIAVESLPATNTRLREERYYFTTCLLAVAIGIAGCAVFFSLARNQKTVPVATARFERAAKKPAVVETIPALDRMSPGIAFNELVRTIRSDDANAGKEVPRAVSAPQVAGLPATVITSSSVVVTGPATSWDTPRDSEKGAPLRSRQSAGKLASTLNNAPLEPRPVIVFAQYPAPRKSYLDLRDCPITSAAKNILASILIH
ncbi:MAG: J domain-containing protein [Rhodomicrobium sp.]